LLKVYVVFAPTNVNLHVATLAPAQLLHAFFERRNSSLTLQIRCSPVHQHADARHRLCLRTRRNWPCYRAAEQCDELAPLIKPTTGITSCWARIVIGHAAAAPPKTGMNSRRRT
jgi:hypothetical protein